MNPRWIEEMSWRMGEVYASVTDRILINLARHFPYIANGATPGGSWDYQIRKLAEMGQVTRETEEIILQSMKGADAALAQLLEETIRESISKVEPDLRKAAENGLLPGRGSMPPETAPTMTQAFKAYYQQSADKMNLVNTVMLESTQEAYRATVADIAARIERTQGILNVATGEVVSGVSSINKAVHDAVQKMVENGITGYIDHGGHHWSPEAYVTMDIRTTLANTARAAVTEQMQEYGCDLFSVSWHDGARPLCYPWQGKVISESNWRGEVEDLDGNKVIVYALDETSYGEPAGLFGVNCGHYKIPFIPGFSKARQPEQDEEQNAKEYEQSQEQRQLERNLRAEKRDLEVLKAQGASEEEIKAQRMRVKAARDNLDTFCEETGRARRSGRERTPIRAEWPDGYQPPKAPTKMPQQTPPATPNTSTDTKKPTSDLVTNVLPASNIPARNLTKWADTPTEQQIIESLGGADQTRGSCSSLAFAYAGNKAGYEVHDFRGGESCTFFATTRNIIEISNFDGVEGITVRNTNDFKASHELFEKTKSGKQYYFHTGRHAAVIRKTESGMEYLELQSSRSNGWHGLNDEELRYRFAAKRSHSTYGNNYEVSSGIIDIDLLKESPDFLEMLRYINTAVGEEKKGFGGGIK